MSGERRQWLVDARKKMNMTQSEVASQAGISRNYLSQVENGTGVRVNVAKKLGKVLGFQWQKFYEDDGEEEAKAQ